MNRLEKYDLAFISVILSGILLGVGGVLLEHFGNPFRTGICVSCFMENVAGSLGLHGNDRMRYLRPEIVGFILGAFLVSGLRKEFQAQSGHPPLIKFVLGLLMMIGAGVYIGCPIKLFYRIAGGELTSLIGLGGLIVGVWIGGAYIRVGFSLGEGKESKKIDGIFIPALAFLLLVFLFVRPIFIHQSTEGPGARFVPLALSLFLGLIIGGFAYYSRYCVLGSIQNFILGKEMTLLYGSFAFLLSAFFTYIFLKDFQPGIFAYQGTSPSLLWDFLGMLLVGFSGVLAGGCPFRQLILAGGGDSNAGVTVLGLLVGGGILQNFSINSSAEGVTFYGKVAVLFGLAICVVIGLTNREA